MKRINIKVTEDFHTRLKVAVALDKTEISEVARKLLEQYVVKIERKKLKH